MKKDFSILKNNVTNSGFCVGCGTCVSMCGHGTIEMRFDTTGKYEPFYSNEESCTACGLCVKVCPFLSENDNEDVIGARKFSESESIHHKAEVGYYLQSYVGYAGYKTRLNGGSGGGLSELLKWLLETDRIDKIVTVESTENPNKLFQYTIIDTAEDVDRCAKSAYYPVELSSVLEQVRKSKDMRYAIVALPCAAKAIELAKKTSAKLKRNILFTFGIVCGQTKTKKYTEFLINEMNIELAQVKSVSYRKKVPDYPSTNYAFKVTQNDNTSTSRMWEDGISNIWINDFAKVNSCNYCDDIFAECSDVVFMDAWLPDYTDDYKGTNLTINRNPQLEMFFEIGRYTEITIHEIIESQKFGLQSKRGFRELYTKLAEPNTPPQKRNFNTTCTFPVKSIRHKKRCFKWSQETREGTFQQQKAIARIMRKRSFRGRLKRYCVMALKNIGISR